MGQLPRFVWAGQFRAYDALECSRWRWPSQEQPSEWPAWYSGLWTASLSRWMVRVWAYLDRFQWLHLDSGYWLAPRSERGPLGGEGYLPHVPPRRGTTGADPLLQLDGMAQGEVPLPRVQYPVRLRTPGA